MPIISVAVPRSWVAKMMLAAWIALSATPAIAFSTVPPLPGSSASARRCTSEPAFASASVAETTTVAVAMTREEGKNAKLQKRLESDGALAANRHVAVQLMELPCIEHAAGPDAEQLTPLLRSRTWDYVAITSPEAARVFSAAWDAVFVADTDSDDSNNNNNNNKPGADANRSGRSVMPKVVAVGKATEKSLEDAGIPVAFCPSKATATILAAELEINDEPAATTTLLYPASAKAGPTLQRDLEKRGFHVTRLNTYDTVSSSWSQEMKENGRRADVACFGSPSAVRGWLANTAEHGTLEGDAPAVLAACIGETSAEACRQLGWPEERIFYPKDNPGIAGWADAVRSAVETASGTITAESSQNS